MKHQTITLVKFKALCRRLKQPMYATMGVLEAIWIFAQIQARNGDLSRYSNLEIAAWIEWPGDEDELIAALVETRWLDRTESGGVRIHDWDDHKPNWLKGIDGRRDAAVAYDSDECGSEEAAAEYPQRVARAGKTSKKRGSHAAETVTKVAPGSELGAEPSTELGSELGTAPSAAPTPQPPNLTQPNPTKPNQRKEPPNPPRGEGGRERPRRSSRSDPDPSQAPAYPDRFLATWESAQPLVVKSTLGCMALAFDLWRRLDLSDHDAVELAWKNYAEARALAGQATQHFATWLGLDWRQYLTPPIVNARIPPEELRRLSEEERTVRDKAYRDWQSACVIATGRNVPPPPKPELLRSPPRWSPVTKGVTNNTHEFVRRHA